MRSLRSAASRHTAACTSAMCLRASAFPATSARTGLTCRSSERKTSKLQRLSPQAPRWLTMAIVRKIQPACGNKLTAICQAGGTPGAAATMHNIACVMAAQHNPNRLVSSCRPWLGTGCRAGACQYIKRPAPIGMPGMQAWESQHLPHASRIQSSASSLAGSASSCTLVSCARRASASMAASVSANPPRLPLLGSSSTNSRKLRPALTSALAAHLSRTFMDEQENISGLQGSQSQTL